MKLKLINGSVLVLGLMLVLLLGEMASRLLRLSPLNSDQPASYHLLNHFTGYDDWGFRNSEIPDSVDIVTIGDSHTFGINASLYTNWPGQVQQRSRKSVYNLSAEYSGPVQYFDFFKNKALKINPRHIVVGYYIGNDPFNAFERVYIHDDWATFRDSTFNKWLTSAERDTLSFYTNAASQTVSAGILNSLHSWLHQKSRLYSLISSTLGLAESGQPVAARLTIPEHNIDETFYPFPEVVKMDIHNKKIQEGLRLSMHFFKQMNDYCKQLGIDFTILLIPTKTMVYSHYLFDNDQLRNANVLTELLKNERNIREISMRFFMANDIEYIDALPLMQRNIDSEKLYPPLNNGHPNQAGYRLIAKSLLNKIQADNAANIASNPF